MFKLRGLPAVCLIIWVINPVLERNDGFNTLWFSLFMGWTAYIFCALIYALEVVGEGLACGPERRQAIIAILIVGGLLPLVTFLEPWRLPSEHKMVFALANSGLALASIGFLLWACILLWRTPRLESEGASGPTD